MLTTMKLYHAEVYMPVGLTTKVCRSFMCQFTAHARQACRSDRYGIIIPPQSIQPTPSNIIEIATNDAHVPVKVVIRQTYDSEKDISIAFVPDFETAIVKTCWLNLKSDTHNTLNRSLYVQP